MQVTEVRLHKLAEQKGNLLALASITFDGEFVVHDIKVIEGQKGRFIAMPSRKNSNGDFKDTAHPLKTELRDRIQQAILEEFENCL